jgi:hypothetical protein
MKKNVSLAVLMFLLFGLGFTSMSQGNISRQSTQSTNQSQSDSTTAKKKKKKTAADSSDAANSTPANWGEASTPPKEN